MIETENDMVGTYEEPIADQIYYEICAEKFDTNIGMDDFIEIINQGVI